MDPAESPSGSHPDDRPQSPGDSSNVPLQESAPLIPLVPAGIFCIDCSNNLAGQPMDVQCKVCATSIFKSLPAITLQPDPSNTSRLLARVRHSTSCVACGYDLVGLDLKDPCPECSQPIIDSVRPFTLRYAPIEHIKHLHRGALFTQLGVMIYFTFTILGMCMAPFFMAALAGAGGGGGGGGTMRIYQFVMTPITIGIILLTAVGLWILTTPFPSIQRAGKTRSRKVVRASLIVVVAAGILLNIVQLLAPLPAWPGGGFGPGGFTPGPNQPVAATAASLMLVMTFIFSSASSIALLVLVTALWYYIRWLAVILPSRLLQRRARDIRSVFVAAILLGITGFVISISTVLYSGVSGIRGGSGVGAFIGCGTFALVGLLVIVLAIMAMILLDTLRSQLGKAVAANVGTNQPWHHDDGFGPRF